MPDEKEMTRQYFSQLVKTLKGIEKAITDASAADSIAELVKRIENITVEAKGDKGDDGKTPELGVDYENGKDGVSIVNATINEAGELVLWYSNNKEVNLGRVVGTDGETPQYDENALIARILKEIVIPQVDEVAIAKRVVKMLPAPKPAPKVKYSELEGAPDLRAMMERIVGERLHRYSQEERRTYTGPAHAAAVIIKDEGVVIAEEVKSIDFRGSNITATNLGDGNIVVTVTGGGAQLKTEVVTGTQEGNNVRIPLSQLSETFLEAMWVAQNGDIIRPGAASAGGEYSSYEIDGTDLLVYWANEADLFMLNYTY